MPKLKEKWAEVRQIRPIETVYNGYRFRSRLEARWAVFFDALGVRYEYEPEGFVLPSGRQYLPDFRVKCWGTRGRIGDEPFDLYIEVKGHMTRYDAERIKEFCGSPFYDAGVSRHAMNPLLIVGGIPREGGICSLDPDDGMDGTGVYPFNYASIDGDYFPAYPAAYHGKFFLWGGDSNYIDNYGERRAVEAAYAKARQARFEFGETPTA